MAISTTISAGTAAEFAFTKRAAQLDARATEHKRMQSYHREGARRARAELAVLIDEARSAGVTIDYSEGV